MQSRATCLLASLVAATALGACSGGASSTAPLAAPQAAQQSRALVDSVRAEVRFNLSPAALQARTATRGPGFISPAARKQATLFVSDLDANEVRLYPAYTKNPTQSGTITQGIDLPINAAVDKHGTLYVANNGNSTVTEYPLGQTTPSVTLSSQLVYPNGIAVDEKGTVYVTSGANVGQCYVLEFPKGSMTPSVQVNGFGLPIGLAVDKHGNLYVGDAESGHYAVWEVPKGSTTPTNLGLAGLADPTGVAIDPSNDLWVSNDYPQGNDSFTVLGFHAKTTEPFATITTGLDGPYSEAIGSNGTLFVGNSFHYPGSISAYKSGSLTPYETFTNGVENPAGLAVYPPPKL
jgi:hypothetical protein